MGAQESPDEKEHPPATPTRCFFTAPGHPLLVTCSLRSGAACGPPWVLAWSLVASRCLGKYCVQFSGKSYQQWLTAWFTEDFLYISHRLTHNIRTGCHAAKSQYPNPFAIPRSDFRGYISRTQTHPGISPRVLYSQASSDAHGYQLPCQLLWLELRITRQRSAQNRSALTVSTLLSKSKPMKSMTREPEDHAHADIVPDTWRRWFSASGSSLGLGGGRQPILPGVQAFLKF